MLNVENTGLTDVRDFFTESRVALPQMLTDITADIRDTALYGRDVPFEISQGPATPEVVVFKLLTGTHHVSSFAEVIDPQTLSELDTLQHGADYFQGERRFVTAERAAIRRARTHMTYRGRHDDFGLDELRGSAVRAFKASSRLIWEATQPVDRAISNGRLYGVPIDVFGPDGSVTSGRIESWGRLMPKYNRAGLRLAVVAKNGEKMIVDVGARNYDLKS